MKLFVSLTALVVIIQSLSLSAAVQRVIICPESDVNVTCKSLSDYAVNEGEHFGNNTEVILLPGTHELSGVLAVVGVSKFSLSCDCSWSKADVKCNEHSSLVFSRSKNITITNINFISCGVNTSQTVDIPIAAALYFEEVTALTLENVNVLNSKGYGIIAAQISGKVFIQYSVFQGNRMHVPSGGNAKLSFQECSPDTSSSLLIQSTEFVNGSTQVNHASGLMVECSLCPGLTVHLDNVTASNNRGGNVYFKMRDSYNWQILITCSKIIGGHGVMGSGLYLISKSDHHWCAKADVTAGLGSSMTINDTHFERNTAEKFGGGFMAKIQDSDCHSTITTLTNCTFIRNVVIDQFGHGAAIKIQKYSIPQFYKHFLPLHQIKINNGNFCENGIQGSEGSVVEFGNIEKAAIEECQFTDNMGTAIASTASDVIFTGDITFDNNTATNGGALRFCDSSAMFLNPNTTVIFKNNFARQMGGAIFAQEACIAEPKSCFFQPAVKDYTPVANLSAYHQIALNFSNNTAGSAGDAIYGGDIDNCFTYTKFESSNGTMSYFLSSEVFNTIFSLDEKEISSEPYQVELCETERELGLSRILTDYNIGPIIPGKSFKIGVVAVGQRSGITPAFITAELVGDNHNTTITQIIHPSTTTKQCTYLNVTLQTTQVETTVELALKVQGSSSQAQNRNIDHHKRNVTLFIGSCPWGFRLDETRRVCVCSVYYNYICDINTLTIRVTPHDDFIWIGCDKSLNNTDSDFNSGLIYAHSCHYCITKVKTIPAVCDDNLCAEHRTGILCGSCLPGWSIVLGTGKCKSCPPSNKYLGLVVVYLAAGILLVLLLTKFKLTVSNGSFNGFLFFANLMHWNRKGFFPQFYNADILRLIIAWLNLDLGIEVCFFDGMTALHVIWLQIGYILYIVFLQVTIIILCRRYVIFTRFFGRNVTKVLSTLLTLLYAKTLTTVASVLKSTQITNGTTHSHYLKVLSVDGNIRFGSREHIPLLVTASFLALFLGMFTFSLLFIQILIKVSSCKWVVRFQPFFETITGPCNFSYAFWPGYLFFMRALYIMLQLFSHHHLSLQDRLLSTCVIVFITIVFSFLGPKGVYKKWSLNILELSLLVNFSITSLLVANGLRKNLHTVAVNTTRVSVAIALFTVLAYHFRSCISVKSLKKIIVACITCVSAKRSKVHQQDFPPVVTRTDVTVSSSVPAEQTPLLPAAQGMPPVMKYDKF